MAENPYDELPYRSLPIEWTAPERLALCSLLHGGPRSALDGYRVLELGCGDGSNLLALAYYRQNAQFVGLDNSQHAIEAAETKRQQLGLPNLRFVNCDIGAAAEHVRGPFDYILVHGVVSWVPAAVLEQLFALCATQLSAAGLLYLNYNTKPGWNVRGMVRRFLLAHTARVSGLAAQVQRAQQVAATAVEALAVLDHPYSKLMEREYRFVCEGHPSYIAHEFLAPDNHAFWRSEFMALSARWGFRYVADADFNYPSGALPEGLSERIAACGLAAEPLEDTIDLFAYRQLHSPIMARADCAARALEPAEFSRLFVASSLSALEGEGVRHYRHASGHEVEAKEAAMSAALDRLAPLYPRGVRAGELFGDPQPWAEDLRLLHRHNLIDLRLIEPEPQRDPARLNACERGWAHYSTNPYHRLELTTP